MAAVIEKISSYALKEMQVLAKNIADALQPPCILALSGDIGTGKTTLIKALLANYGISPCEVQSPTFSYLHIYDSPKLLLPVCHFDLYRLSSSKEFMAMGFEEYFDTAGICLIEWSERIKDLLQEKKKMQIHIKHAAQSKRTIEITYA